VIQWQQHAAQSPLVLPDGRVTFRLVAPDASLVSVHNTTGGYTDWPNGNDVPLTKDAQGLWSVTIGSLKAEFFTYPRNSCSSCQGLIRARMRGFVSSLYLSVPWKG
jgi:hypothetical protein